MKRITNLVVTVICLVVSLSVVGCADKPVCNKEFMPLKNKPEFVVDNCNEALIGLKEASGDFIVYDNRPYARKPPVYSGVDFLLDAAGAFWNPMTFAAMITGTLANENIVR